MAIQQLFHCFIVALLLGCQLADAHDHGHSGPPISESKLKELELKWGTDVNFSNMPLY